MKDPISDSESKLAMLREHFAGIVIKELSAGYYNALSSETVPLVGVSCKLICKFNLFLFLILQDTAPMMSCQKK